MTDLRNRTALITGSARGIDRAIALRYASLGADIALNYANDDESVARTVSQIEQYGVDVVAIRADVSQPDQVERMFSDTVRRFGKVDIVVANAGVEIIDQALLDATEEQFDPLSGVTVGSRGPPVPACSGIDGVSRSGARVSPEGRRVPAPRVRDVPR